MAEKIREEFTEYFSLERPVKWQWEYRMNQNLKKTFLLLGYESA